MNKDENIAYLILAFIIILFILLVFFVSLILIFADRLKKNKREAMQNMFEGTENEKQKISRDLHDHIVPELAELKFKLDKIDFEGKTQSEIGAIKSQLTNSIAEIRGISHSLVSHSLEKYGLAEAIREFLYKSPVKEIEYDVNDKAAESKIKKEVAQHMFAIFKELHMNTIKHSSATKSQVILEIEHSDLKFIYFDNGEVEGGKIKEGIGLRNIRSRVEQLKGKLVINSKNNFSIEILVNNAEEYGEA